MPKSSSDLITIVRNVTGRVDNSDPLFTDQIMLQYINDFYVLEMGQDLRITERNTWWEFTIDQTTPGSAPLPINLNLPLQNIAVPPAPQIQFTTIGPPAYIEGFEVWWYQDPQQFYARWPETQLYVPSRPIAILYYNNELVFRQPPDALYNVKIQAYQMELEIPPGGMIANDYLWRYICYGAAMDIFADYGEMDKWNEIYPAFQRYRANVYGRTYQQNMSQRSTPKF